MNYDLIVLGGGPAGYLAGERAGHAGLSVLVIEERALGGVCLNEGCIPSKAFLHSAKVYDYALRGDKYGVTVTGASIDQKKVVERKNKVVRTLVSGIGVQLKAAKAEVVRASGKITGKTPNGYTVEAGEKVYTAKNILIATGSEAIVPGSITGIGEGVKSGMVMTNREILDLTEIPKTLTVIGGGVIGLEMASYFNSAGSAVTVIEALDHIAGPTDSDISQILQKELSKKGVIFRLSAKAAEIRPGEVIFEQNGETHTVPSQKVLLSIGRRPRTEGIGLESVGMYTERGAIVTGECMKTNVPGIYAAGDINGKSMLAHTAYREAEVAVNNILGKSDMMSYMAIPSVIYTNPEAGAVGMTEGEAALRGYAAEVVTIPMAYSGRYVAETVGGKGICKLVIDKKDKRLLGCHVIGSYSSEFIVAAGIMIETHMRTDYIRKMVFPHPTVCEIIREAIFQSKN